MSKYLVRISAAIFSLLFSTLISFPLEWSVQFNSSLLDTLVRGTPIQAFKSKVANPALPPSAIVYIDEAALSAYPYITPVPRDLLARTINFLDEAGARLIVLDVFLKDESFPESDKLLVDALRDADKVILVSILRDHILRNEKNTNIILNSKNARIDKNHEKFLSVAVGTGVSTTPREKIDDTVRFYYRDIAFGEETLYPLASVAAKYLGEKLPKAAKFRLLFTGPPQNTPQDLKESLAGEDIFHIPAFMIDQNFVGEDLKKKLKDRVVFVGVNVNDIKEDFYNTPYYSSATNYSPTAGVEIHAQAYETIRHGIEFRSFPYWGTATLALFFAATMTLVVFQFHWILASVLLLIQLVFALLVLPIQLFPFGVEAPMFFLSVLAISTFLTAFIARALTEDKQKRFIKNAFQKFIAPEYVEQLVDNPELLELGGEEKYITILFSDLAGFTSLSEAKTPRDLVNFLNEYLDGMTKIVQKHGGTLDKFIGDAIMAFWNAPVPQTDHAERAVRAAIEMKEFSQAMSARLEKEGFGVIATRIGLNSGKAIVGNMGASSQFNYTAIGDEINLGARLEGANKNYGTFIMISESTQNLVCGSSITTRELDTIRVKGKAKPVKVFEAGVGALSQEYLKSYQSALATYYDGKFAEALSKFDKLHAIHPEDPLPKLFRERCTLFRDNPPENWDGCFTMTSK